MTDVVRCEVIPVEKVDFSDPIFDSIRHDYPDHDEWHRHAIETKESRCALVVHASLSAYAGIAILKYGESPDGPRQTGLKISMFKVAPHAQAQGIADILLAHVFEQAIEKQIDVVFITVLPNHEDVSRYLELRGFRRLAVETSRGERIYVADISHPERIYSDLNRLAYDLLADEYRSRSYSPGPTQESPEYLAGLLTKHLRTSSRRVLELGPGSGEILRALGAAAIDTVAVEISPRMAMIARQRAPNALILISDILNLDFPPGSFDGIYAGAFLHLFPQSEAARLVHQIARWTCSDGTVFVNTSIADEFSECLELKADYLHRVARFRSRWTEAQFQRLVESNGLSIMERITTDERERGKYWVAYLCKPSKQYEDIE